MAVNIPPIIRPLYPYLWELPTRAEADCLSLWFRYSDGENIWVGEKEKYRPNTLNVILVSHLGEKYTTRKYKLMFRNS